MQIHSGEKPYQRTVCDKQFTLSSFLKSHMLLHSGGKPYQCKNKNKLLISSVVTLYEIEVGFL